jgi:hypothetical protein
VFVLTARMAPNILFLLEERNVVSPLLPGSVNID